MEYDISFNYNARYCKIGRLDPQEGQIWIVLHGYGQLAPFFIQKFEFLAQQGHCIIAPEGLSRFYLRGFSGRVGATWMTSEDRLRDIENYLKYLDAIYQKEISKFPNTCLNLLGFSQGSSTASRWVARGNIRFHRLILWAGMFPDDMDHDQARRNFINKPLYLVYGTRDRFITRGRLAAHRKVVLDLGLAPSTITFDGDHDIHETTLNKIAAMEQ